MDIFEEYGRLQTNNDLKNSIFQLLVLKITHPQQPADKTAKALLAAYCPSPIIGQKVLSLWDAEIKMTSSWLLAVYYANYLCAEFGEIFLGIEISEELSNGQVSIFGGEKFSFGKAKIQDFRQRKVVVKSIFNQTINADLRK